MVHENGVVRAFRSLFLALPDQVLEALDDAAQAEGEVVEAGGERILRQGTWVEEHALLMAPVWPLVITLVFLPLAVRGFQRLSR